MFLFDKMYWLTRYNPCLKLKCHFVVLGRKFVIALWFYKMSDNMPIQGQFVKPDYKNTQVKIF